MSETRLMDITGRGRSPAATPHQLPIGPLFCILGWPAPQFGLTRGGVRAGR
jgi:hypothetical protein